MLTSTTTTATGGSADTRRETQSPPPRGASSQPASPSTVSGRSPDQRDSSPRELSESQLIARIPSQERTANAALTLMLPAIKDKSAILLQAALEPLTESEKQDKWFGYLLQVAIVVKMHEAVVGIVGFKGAEHVLPSAIKLWQDTPKGEMHTYDLLIDTLASKENLVFNDANRGHLQEALLTMIRNGKRDHVRFAKLMIPNVIEQVELPALLIEALQYGYSRIACLIVNHGDEGLAAALAHIQTMHGLQRTNWDVSTGYEDARAAIIKRLGESNGPFTRHDLVQISRALIDMIEQRNKAQDYRISEIRQIVRNKTIIAEMVRVSAEQAPEQVGGEVFSLEKLLARALDATHGEAMIELINAGAVNLVNIIRAMQRNAAPVSWLASWVSTPLDQATWKSSDYDTVYKALLSAIKVRNDLRQSPEDLVQILHNMIRSNDIYLDWVLDAPCTAALTPSDWTALAGTAREKQSWSIALKLLAKGARDFATALAESQTGEGGPGSFVENYRVALVGQLRTDQDALKEDSEKEKLVLALGYMLQEGHDQALELLRESKVIEALDSYLDLLLDKAVETCHADAVILLAQVGWRNNLASCLLKALQAGKEEWTGAYRPAIEVLISQLVRFPLVMIEDTHQVAGDVALADASDEQGVGEELERRTIQAEKQRKEKEHLLFERDALRKASKLLVEKGDLVSLKKCLDASHLKKQLELNGLTDHAVKHRQGACVMALVEAGAERAAHALAAALQTSSLDWHGLNGGSLSDELVRFIMAMRGEDGRPAVMPFAGRFSLDQENQLASAVMEFWCWDEDDSLARDSSIVQKRKIAMFFGEGREGLLDRIRAPLIGFLLKGEALDGVNDAKIKKANEQKIEKAWSLIEPLLAQKRTTMLLFVIHRLQCDDNLLNMTPEAAACYDKIIDLIRVERNFVNWGDPLQPGSTLAVGGRSHAQTSQGYFNSVMYCIISKQPDNIDDLLRLAHIEKRLDYVHLLSSSITSYNFACALTMVKGLEQAWVSQRAQPDSKDLQDSLVEKVEVAFRAVEKSLAITDQLLEAKQKQENTAVRVAIADFLNSPFNDTREAFRQFFAKDQAEARSDGSSRPETRARRAHSILLSLLAFGEEKSFCSFYACFAPYLEESTKKVYLYMALQNGLLVVAADLDAKGVKLEHEQNNHCLVASVQQGRTAVVQFLCQRDTQLDLMKTIRQKVRTQQKDCTLLVFSICAGLTEIAGVLIQYGRDNNLDQDYETALKEEKIRRGSGLYSLVYSSGTLVQADFQELERLVGLVVMQPLPTVDEEVGDDSPRSSAMRGSQSDGALLAMEDDRSKAGKLRDSNVLK